MEKLGKEFLLETEEAKHQWKKSEESIKEMEINLFECLRSDKAHITTSKSLVRPLNPWSDLLSLHDLL